MIGHSFAELLGTLVALLVSTKVLGVAAQRFGQPSIVGELVAGVLLGGSVLGILDPADPVLHALAELGVLILLFEIGLHTNLRSLTKVGREATTVALVGVALPFGFGYAAATILGLGTIPAIVSGAALTATSIGISARTLSDLGKLDTPEGQIVLGAAVLDDIVGLIILSVVSGIVGGAAFSIAGVATTTAVAMGFVVAALVLGPVLVPPMFRAIGRIEASGTLGVAGLAFAFLLAFLADLAGSATIIGAFSAGLLLNDTPQRATIEKATTHLGHFFVPIFFAMVGAAVELRTLADARAIAIGLTLVAAGVVGKVLAGYAPFWFKGDKALIGVAMVPRGEVGLIFASMGLATGALTSDLYSAIAMMVLATTFITPPFLAQMIKSRTRHASGAPADQPGDGGIDDLVAGAATGQHAVTAPVRPPSAAGP
ncbi:MAG TPA: cation:proton antiporter [Gemmatimonadaceae bacterium]|nr:cation:proton antiporter [Gemmatimonadaceae bacterium]